MLAPRHQRTVNTTIRQAMNNTFNLLRFYHFFRKTVLERPWQIIGIVLLNFIVILILYAFLRDIIGWNPTQNLTFNAGFVFGGCYLSATLFNYFSSNANGFSFLTLPVSLLEKWLCAMLITWVLYVIAFFVFYVSIDHLFVSYYHHHLNVQDPHYAKLQEAVQPFDLRGHVATSTYIMFGILTAAMFVGSMYFNKMGFIKTGLFICALLILVFALNMMVAHAFFPNVRDAFPFSHVSVNLPGNTSAEESALAIRMKDEGASIELPAPYSAMYRVFLRYILVAVLMVAAFFRLKEKEF